MTVRMAAPRLRCLDLEKAVLSIRMRSTTGGKRYVSLDVTHPAATYSEEHSRDGGRDGNDAKYRRILLHMNYVVKGIKAQKLLLEKLFLASRSYKCITSILLDKPRFF